MSYSFPNLSENRTKGFRLFEYWISQILLCRNGHTIYRNGQIVDYSEYGHPILSVNEVHAEMTLLNNNMECLISFMEIKIKIRKLLAKYATYARCWGSK